MLANASIPCAQQQPPLSSQNWPEVAVPDVLTKLQENGFVFVHVPDYTWQVEGWDARLRKKLSVSFAVDTLVYSQEILEGFDKAVLDINNITSIQRRVSSNTWVVSLIS